MRLTLQAAAILVMPSALAGQATDWRVVAPVRVSQAVILADTRLLESSGVALSRSIPGVLFTINDSGNDPIVYATDTTGRSIGAWLVPQATNRDWETITVGPCPSGSCIYLGDTGDNRELQASVRIYRIPEPAQLGPFLSEVSTGSTNLDSLVLQYPDGPHDVEAMYLDDAGAIYLVSKGRTKGVLVFRIPPTAWSGPGTVTADLLDSLPLPSRNSGDWVTDAARLPGTSRVVVRTYNTLYFFEMNQDGGLRATEPAKACDVTGLETQGEGVDWLDSKRQVLTSERGLFSAGMLRIIQCFK
jgi:hypothetical protein